MPDSISLPSPGGPSSPQDRGQYREYFIPASNISEEQKLLEQYAEKRFGDALRGIYTDFYLLIELMRGYTKYNDSEDYTYFLLAEKLQQPLDRLSKACSAIGDWKLISRRIADAEA